MKRTSGQKIKILTAALVVFAFGAGIFSRVLASGPVPLLNYPFNGEEMTAKSYVVVDKATGQVLLDKDPEILWTPASMTKLVTAMVVLEINPKLTGTVAMVKSDEVGGARLSTVPGVTYKVKDLFYASLVASANNATNALARSTGLSRQEFVERMNKKAAELGTLKTLFVEPTGIDPKNVTTARDFSKIAETAFNQSQIQDADARVTYSMQSVNGKKKYTHNLKTTNQILRDKSLLVVGAKTGYLEESRYNFTAEVKDVNGKNIIIVLLGSKNTAAQFFETKKLASWSWLNYKWDSSSGQVAGAFTGVSMPQ